jgi:hypothetical protein
VLDQFLRSAVEQSDMRIDALNNLAVEFEHKTQNAMGRRVLGPEIYCEIADSSFGHTCLMSAAGMQRCRVLAGSKLLTGSEAALLS